METKDLIIVVLSVIVVLFAVIAIVCVLNDNVMVADDNNDTVDNDTGNVTIVINQPVTKEVKKVTPVKKNTTEEPYLVKKVWSEQQEGYLYYYSDGKVYNEQGQRVDDIS